MPRSFSYDASTGILNDDVGPVCRIDPAYQGGHVQDYGALIAKLLSWHAEACSDMGGNFYGPILDTREGR